MGGDWGRLDDARRPTRPTPISVLASVCALLGGCFTSPGVGFPTIGPSERLSTRLDGLGQFLVLRYLLTPLWTESKLSRPLVAL